MERLPVLMGFALILGCAGGGASEGRADEGPGLTTLGPSDTSTEGNDDGSSTDSASADSNGDEGEAKFDLSIPDAPHSCGGTGGDTLSNIWIANSSQNSVSKIDTQTMIEQGRYYVRPDHGGNPSRTSVSLSANVAIASRAGGVSKIYHNIDNCVESNGMPGIQTSSGAELLPWGQEECVAWHTPLAYSSNRPVAWAQGTWDETTCSWVNEKLWTSGANGAGTTQVLLLDGDTGLVEQTVAIPEVQNGIGLYGGAVDGDGHFWGIETGGARLIRVDRNDFTYQIWNGPGVASYGMALDSVGRPWFCAGGGASRFDPQLQTWQTLPSPGGNQWGGCMTDGEGTLWHSRQLDAMLVGIDTETLQVTKQIQLPAYAHGISIDFDGYVWAVGFASTDAYRVDPDTATVDTFSNLVGAYTYSDMTGFALSSAGVPNG
ncbi:hypothetical protein [Enhygromyxa salina]|uniref:Vgb family protein n=1 Tax=Enhygromyxa salina TaxID=215803 RepID=UPI0006979BF9|nr:hypothetical protein [Enhygromyxa salina]